MVAVFAFGHEQLGEEAAVGELVTLELVGGLGEPGPDGGMRSTRQAVSIAASAACSLMPRVRVMAVLPCGAGIAEAAR